MGVADWRAWVAQDSTVTFGGHLPTAPNPPGTPAVPALFPGVQPINDLISGSTSIPNYANVPTTINALDPFYVGTYPTGYGWTDQHELVANSGGAQTPVMRPVVAGITS